MKQNKNPKTLNPAYWKHKALRKEVNEFVGQVKHCIDVKNNVELLIDAKRPDNKTQTDERTI